VGGKDKEKKINIRDEHGDYENSPQRQQMPGRLKMKLATAPLINCQFAKFTGAD
jgi:hypothetical protein